MNVFADLGGLNGDVGHTDKCDRDGTTVGGARLLQQEFLTKSHF
jgi:hypothetical protein